MNPRSSSSLPLPPPLPPLAPFALALLLAGLSAIGPFSIDTYLPSFPAIGTALSASPLEVQQTLSFYLIPFAFMSLWHGALADALGRRQVLLYALAAFTLASAGCALTTSILQLWILRALQGVTAGAGIVIGRAIVRDIHAGPEAQRLMSHITIIFALAPAIAPVLGGWLEVHFGWRSVFVFMTLAAGLLWLICWRRLPETLAPAARQPLHPVYLLGAYKEVLGHPAFLALTLALGANFLGFFLYILSAPVFVIQHLHLGETDFLWLFGPAMGGMMCGAWLSGRMAGKVTTNRLLALAYVTMGSAAAANLGISFLLAPGLPWSVTPFFLYTLGMSMAMPQLTLLALDMFPEKRGLAASCQMFLQSTANGLAAGVLAPALWGSPHSLALGMAVLLAIGLVATQLGRWVQRG